MKKENLPRIGFATIIVAFAYLAVKLLVYGTPINLVAWGLWVIINTMLLTSLFFSGNRNPFALAGFEIGSITITTIAIIKTINGNNHVNIGWPEVLVTACVLIALKIRRHTQDNSRLILMTATLCLAMLPTLYDQWKSPAGHDSLFWGLCCLGCLLEYIGKPKDIVNGLFPACGALFSGAATILSLRQYF
ncbi:MAG: hypothetical protein V4576_04230 [Patescibacteria group bacterium]